MSLLNTSKRRGSRAITGGGGGGGLPTTFGNVGGNMNGIARFAPERPWINEVRGADLNFTVTGSPYVTIPAYQNAQGWLTAMPAGASVTLYIAASSPGVNDSLLPGDYKASTTANVTLAWTDSGANVTNKVSGVSLATCTIPVSPTGDYSNDNGYQWALRITNTSGAPLDVTDLAVYHVEDEARFLAGKTWRSRWLGFYKDLYVIRLLDYMGANEGATAFSERGKLDNLAELPTEAWRHWASQRGPASVLGKMCAEMIELYPTSNFATAGTLHPCLPAFCNSERFTATTGTNKFSLANDSGVIVNKYAENTPVAIFNGTPTAPVYGSLTGHVVYYVKNRTTTDFELSLTPGGASVTVAATVPVDPSFGIWMDRIDRPYETYFNSILADIKANCGTLPFILPEWSNEVWGFQFAQRRNVYGGPANSAGFLGDGPRGQAHMQLLGWKAALNAGFTESQLIRGVGAFTLNDAFAAGVMAHTDTAGVFSGSLSFAALLQAGTNKGQYLIAPYCYMRNAGVEMDGPALVAAGGASMSDADLYLYHDNYINEQLRPAVQARITYLAGVAPLAEVSTYESGNHVWVSGTGVALFGERYKEWLSSVGTNSGLAWFQNYRQKIFLEPFSGDATKGLRNQLQFVMAGGWSNSDTITHQWGLTRGHYDLPLTTLFNYFTQLQTTNSIATGQPTISGTPTVGSTLTANTGSIADVNGLGSFSYYWQINGSNVASGNASTFVVPSGSDGKRVRVVVTYTDGTGRRETVASAPVTVGVVGHWTGTTFASDGSVSDINTKIAAAANGDTVTIPAGAFTWSGAITLNKGVHLRGAGGGKINGRSVTSLAIGTGSKVFTTHASGLRWTAGEAITAIVPNASGNTMTGTVTSYTGTTLTINVTSVTGSGTFDFWVFQQVGATVVTMDTGAAINVTEVASHYVGVGAFDITRGTSTSDIFGVTGSASNKPLIAHDGIYTLGTGSTDCFDTNTTTHLLAYNLSFLTAMSSPAAGIRTTSCFRLKNPGNTSSWTTAPTYGTASTGEDSYFVEDCTFIWFSTEVADFDDNSRTVWRYNDMNHSGITSHGQDTSAHGVRHYEVYNNHLYCNNDQTGALIPNLDYQLYLRGGSGVVTDNVFTEISNGEWGDKTDLKLTCQSLRRNAGPNACYAGSYPCPRQIGQGHNGTTTTTEGVYIWNNTGAFDLGVDDYSPDECGGGPAGTTFIQAARDYFTTAKPSYTKYAYPHPLRAGV